MVEVHDCARSAAALHVVGMKYDIITADSAKYLGESVNEMLARGWQLQGGVSVSLSETDEYRHQIWAQAMTLAETPQPT